MQKVVIDTNIIIAAFITPNGLPARVIDLVVSDEKMAICYNEGILAEYEEVLLREKFKKYNFDPDKIKSFMYNVKQIGIFVDPPKSDIFMPHESDRNFYDTANESGAILITGNAKHYPRKKSFIMSPVEFLQHIYTIILLME